VNGVAPRHAETTRRMFPGYDIRAIGNGVHPATWTDRAFARLYDRYFPKWAHEPESLICADQLPDEEISAAHEESKRRLMEFVKARTGTVLDERLPTIGFARRMTGYKRPALIFSDPARLRAINKRFPFQVVFAGKAHPQDREGKRLIESITGQIAELSGEMRMAYLPNYDMDCAARLVSGVDIWLNTPLPPLEASGTSGMKAAMNGVLNLSVLDGWWLDAALDDVTGWAIGNHDPEDGGSHAAALYDVLERRVLPLYYNDRGRWMWMMKQSISKIAPRFNSQDMMRRYAAEAYLR
jgi:starch phosphorylase